MRLSGRITQTENDGGDEETERVTRITHGVETESVEPDLWIFECLKHAIPGEDFVPSSVAVLLEPRGNVFLLLLSEELGIGGVVKDEKVGGDGADNGKQTLLERHVISHTEIENR